MPASSVCPSGVERATACAPMAVLAPGRFSTTMGCAHRSVRRCATTREIMSAGPPAGNGTTMRIGRLGKSFGSLCAAAGAAAVTNSAIVTRARESNSSIPPPEGEGGRPKADRVVDITDPLRLAITQITRADDHRFALTPPGLASLGHPPLSGEGWSKLLIQLQAHGLDHLGARIGLRADEGRKLFRRGAGG